MAKLSAEHRRKISEAQKRRYLKSLASRKDSAVTHKRCSGFERGPHTEFIESFGTRKQLLKSGVTLVSPRSYCHSCEAARVADWKRRKEAEGTWSEFRKRKEDSRDRDKMRLYQREWHTAKRREEGKETAYSPFAEEENRARGKKYDAEPLVEFLKGIDVPDGLLSKSLIRRLYALKHGEQIRVSLHTIDALLHALRCPEKLHELYPVEESKLVGYQILDPDGVLESVRA